MEIHIIVDLYEEKKEVSLTLSVVKYQGRDEWFFKGFYRIFFLSFKKHTVPAYLMISISI